MLRRLALLITTVVFASAAHATGNLVVDLDRSGQFYVDHAPAGVPIGTPVNALTTCSRKGDNNVKTCVAMTDATHGVVQGQPAPRLTLLVDADVLVDDDAVVSETISVHDINGRARLRVDMHPDYSVTLKAF